MTETTVTLGGCDLDCTFTVTGGKFRGDHMQPADPIEVEVVKIWYGDPVMFDVTDLIEACGMTQEVETLIRESL
jgi:hypothetical protein